MFLGSSVAVAKALLWRLTKSSPASESKGLKNLTLLLRMLSGALSLSPTGVATSTKPTFDGFFSGSAGIRVFSSLETPRSCCTKGEGELSSGSTTLRRVKQPNPKTAPEVIPAGIRQLLLCGGALYGISAACEAHLDPSTTTIESDLILLGSQRRVEESADPCEYLSPIDQCLKIRGPVDIFLCPVDLVLNELPRITTSGSVLVICEVGVIELILGVRELAVLEGQELGVGRILHSSIDIADPLQGHKCQSRSSQREKQICAYPVFLGGPRIEDRKWLPVPASIHSWRTCSFTFSSREALNSLGNVSTNPQEQSDTSRAEVVVAAKMALVSAIPHFMVAKIQRYWKVEQAKEGNADQCMMQRIITIDLEPKQIITPAMLVGTHQHHQYATMGVEQRVGTMNCCKPTYGSTHLVSVAYFLSIVDWLQRRGGKRGDGDA
ncbi:hypothetical protein KCU65_g478, partial [Aureobasidium melanogenum]